MLPQGHGPIPNVCGVFTLWGMEYREPMCTRLFPALLWNSERQAPEPRRADAECFEGLEPVIVRAVHPPWELNVHPDNSHLSVGCCRRTA